MTYFAILVLVLAYISSTTSSDVPGLLIPLYVYPADNGRDTWKTVGEAASANPSVPFVAVVNPNSGPGSSLDSQYASAVSDLVNAGVKCIGYVSTDYSKVPTSTATGNMDLYKSWYPQISGFFLDEMANTGSHESYYKELTDYAISIGYPFTVGNPGTSTTEAYFDTVCNTVIYETQPLPNPSVLNLGFPSSRCSMIAYNVPGSELNQSYIDEITQYVSLVYITDDVLNNPYDTIPTYFTQLVAYLANTGQNK